MGLVIVLSRVFRLCTRAFFVLVALGLAAVFVLIALSAVGKGPGSPTLQHLIRSNGFFPWPVATIFALAGVVPWIVGIGVVGAVVGGVLRRFLLRDSEEIVASVLAISQTGTTVNSRPQMKLRLQLGEREVVIKALMDLADACRTWWRFAIRALACPHGVIRAEC